MGERETCLYDLEVERESSRHYLMTLPLSLALRTAGIPSRPVTNFRSAHDADANRAIDYYFDQNNKPIDSMTGDSIW